MRSDQNGPLAPTRLPFPCALTRVRCAPSPLRAAGNHEAASPAKQPATKVFSLSRATRVLLMSLVESVRERVALVGESEQVIEEERPAADDLSGVATNFALDPFPARGIADAREPERKGRHHVKRGRGGVRETHKSLVAAPSGVAQP